MIAADSRIEEALRHGGLIDITTTGRRSAMPRRLELVFHNLDGRIFITGRPSSRQRSWIANLKADPRFTFHLKDAVAADLPARASVIGDPGERARIIPAIVAVAGWTYDVDAMIASAPLIEVIFD